jgi:hypothetical protein
VRGSDQSRCWQHGQTTSNVCFYIKQNIL